MPGRARAGLAGGLVAFLLLAAVPASLASQEERQQDCCLLLLVPVGARASALGGAITARSGSDATFRNPAGLWGVRGGAFLLHHADRSVVDVNAFSLIVGGAPAAGGLSYQLFDYGTQLMRDETGQTTGELTNRDHLLVASLAVGIGREMAVGASYRMFQERIDCRGACAGQERVSTFHAVDLGYRYSPAWQPALQLGASLVNVPVWVHADGAAGVFPARVHLGAAFDLLSPFGRADLASLRLAVDLQDELLNPGNVVPSVGLELDMQQAIFLRAGYTPGEGLASGAAVGLELRYDRFDVGVSRSFVNTSLVEDEPFQITFGIRF